MNGPPNRALHVTAASGMGGGQVLHHACHGDDGENHVPVRVNMGSGERSGPGGRDDWRLRLTSALGVATCMAGALLIEPVVGINGFWPGMLAIIVAISVGIVLGRLVGGLVFRPSSGCPPDHPPHA